MGRHLIFSIATSLVQTITISLHDRARHLLISPPLVIHCRAASDLFALQRSSKILNQTKEHPPTPLA